MRRTSSPANLKDLKYQRVEGDLSDFESLKRAVSSHGGMNYVFHLAGATAAPTRASFFECNAGGTASLARAVAEAGVKPSRFVYVSSLAAGGPALSREPRKETDPDRPVSAYGESKREGERELLRYSDRFPISIVRPPLVYGPKDKNVFLIIKTIARNVMPILAGSRSDGGDGKKYYSVIHVKDLARGIVQAGLAPADKVPSGEIFYLADDRIHSYQEFLHSVSDCLGNHPVKFPVPKALIRVAALAATAAGKLTGKSFALNMDKLNEVLPDYWICSNEKAKKMLGFSTEYQLSTGMPQTIQWYRRQGWL
jgi:nucleoside-diphosphate-sugar epimerase